MLKSHAASNNAVREGFIRKKKVENFLTREGDGQDKLSSFSQLFVFFYMLGPRLRNDLTFSVPIAT